jgi:hypothetical protein
MSECECPWPGNCCAPAAALIAHAVASIVVPVSVVVPARRLLAPVTMPVSVSRLGVAVAVAVAVAATAREPHRHVVDRRAQLLGHSLARTLGHPRPRWRGYAVR